MGRRKREKEGKSKVRKREEEGRVSEEDGVRKFPL